MGKFNIEAPEKNRTASKKTVMDHHKNYSEAIENVVNKARTEGEAIGDNQVMMINRQKKENLHKSKSKVEEEMEVEYASTDSEITSPAKKMMLSKSFNDSTYVE